MNATAMVIICEPCDAVRSVGKPAGTAHDSLLRLERHPVDRVGIRKVFLDYRMDRGWAFLS
jgi:hypothetical protein